MLVIASNGPFGPTVGGCCILLVVFLVIPLYNTVLTVWSLCNSDPVRRPLLILMVLGSLVLGYFVLWLPMPWSQAASAWFLGTLWCYAAVIVVPVVVVREGIKANWWRQLRTRRRP